MSSKACHHLIWSFGLRNLMTMRGCLQAIVWSHSETNEQIVRIAVWRIISKLWYTITNKISLAIFWSCSMLRDSISKFTKLKDFQTQSSGHKSRGWQVRFYHMPRSTTEWASHRSLLSIQALWPRTRDRHHCGKPTELPSLEYQAPSHKCTIRQPWIW